MSLQPRDTAFRFGAGLHAVQSRWLQRGQTKFVVRFRQLQHTRRELTGPPSTRSTTGRYRRGAAHRNHAPGSFRPVDACEEKRKPDRPSATRPAREWSYRRASPAERGVLALPDRPLEQSPLPSSKCPDPDGERGHGPAPADPQTDWPGCSRFHHFFRRRLPVILREVGVLHRHDDRLVPEQLLNRSDVDAAHH